MYNNQEYNQYDNALMNIQIILKESQMHINHNHDSIQCRLLMHVLITHSYDGLR